MANDRPSGVLARPSGIAGGARSRGAGLRPAAGAPDVAEVAAASAAEAAAAPFATGGDGADPLSAALRAVRLTGALFFFVDATSPWCVDIPETRAYADIILPEARHVLSYHVVVEGAGLAAIPGAEPMRVAAGDVILFPHGDAYAMKSARDAPPEFDRAETLEFFRMLADGRLPFVVTEGGGEPPPARVICGFLGCDVGPLNPLLAGLPRMLKLRLPEGALDGGPDMLGRLIAMTLEEARTPRAGGEGVGARLAELLFVELLRRYAAAPGPKPPGWLAGLGDAPVARALAAIHARPAERWTVAALAREAGLSRSALAERFAARVGMPPARYLALWRMQLAAGMLAEGGVQAAEAGRRVGYASEAAFSRAFKRVAGMAPDAWRRAGAGAG